MQHVTVVQALLVALIMYASKFFDWGFLNIQIRPIILGPLVGLVLGDFQLGIIIGASIEAVFMGTFSVGGSVPSDIASAGVLGTAFGILAGQSASKAVALGVSLSIPVGLLAVLLFNLVVLCWNFLVDYEDRAIASRKEHKFTNAHIFAMVVYPIPFAIMAFIAIYAGVTPVQHFMAALPAQVNQILNVMSQMLPALGMAILLKSMWDKDIVPFFFIGFAIAAYLKVGTMGIAVFGAAIAVYYIFNDFKHAKEIAALKKQRVVSENNAEGVTDEMEDFLS